MLTALAAALAAALRLPGLTVFLTADEARSWFGRSIIFLDSLLHGNLANTAPGGTVAYIDAVSLSPAPGVTTMWAGALGIGLEYLRQLPGISLADFLRNIPFDPLNPAMLVSLRLPGVLAAVLAVGLTYWWSRPLLGRSGAFLAAGFLALDPFYLALSRVLGHDALVTTFMWLSLLALLRVVLSFEFSVLSSTAPTQNQKSRAEGPLWEIQNPKLIWLLISGVFGGLAFLSKYPALFVGAFATLALLLVYLRRARSLGVGRALALWLHDMAIWSLAAGVVFVVCWPAMWVSPIETVSTILADALRASGGAHPKGSFFLGQPVPDPGALFYPIVVVFRTTPIVFLGALLALWRLALSFKFSVLSFKFSVLSSTAPAQNQKSRAEGPLWEIKNPKSIWLLILLGYIILYALLVTYGGKKQDRYLLPAFPAIAMLAAMGYTFLLAAARRGSESPPGWLWLLPGSVLLLQVLMVLPSYPYYFSYYNPLAGGGPAAARLIQVGWGEGLNEAADYLNTLPGSESANATSWYSTTFEPYFHGHAIYKIDDEKISRSPKPGLAADYVVFYINQTQRRLPSDGALAYFQRAEPLHTVVLNGLPYAWIYAAPGVSHLIAGEARLVGQAELLGFDWLNTAGERLTAIPSNSAATLRLYWEWQGKADDDPIGLSLVDAAGSTVGWANLIDPGQPITNSAPLDRDAGAIVISEYALAVFPGTPPGQYTLRAWIDRPANGEVVGQFPLDAADAAVTVAPPLTPATAADFDIRQPIDAAFGPLRLLGYNFNADTWEPGQSRQLELFWASSAAMPHDAAAQLKLMPHSAEIPAVVTPVWQRPITPAYPTARWQPGDHYRDIWPLDLPATAPQGDYDLQLTVAGVTQTIGQVRVGGRERLFARPPIANPLDAAVGDSIRLLGFDATPAAGSVAVTLLWQARQTPPEDYTVFVQLLNASGQLVTQNDSAPQAGAAPTGSWAAGEVIVDSHTLSLAAGESGSGYRLIAGLYRPADGQRLPITANGVTSDALTLATIELK